MYVSSSSTYAGGTAVNSTNSGSTWTIVAAQDYGFEFIMPFTGESIATGLTSGEHTLKITADGTNLKTYWDGAEKDSDALGGLCVIMSNGWTSARMMSCHILITSR